MIRRKRSIILSTEEFSRAKRAAGIAFLLLLLLFLTVNTLQLRSLASKGEYSRFVATLGYQRTRAESLAKNSLILASGATGPIRYRAREEFASHLRGLGSFEVAFRNTSIHDAIDDLYADDLESEFAKARAALVPFWSACHDLDVALAESKGETTAATLAANAKIQQTGRTYLKRMNGFVTDFADRAARAIQFAGVSTLGLVALFFVTLIGQARLIFRPVVDKMQAALDHARRLQSQIEAQNELLNDHNFHLEDQKRALDEQRLELEEQNSLLQLSQAQLEEQQDELAAQNRQIKQQKEKFEQMAESLKISQDLQAQATRRAEELFTGVPVACFSFDRDGVLHQWNRTAEEVYGFQAFEVLWKPMWIGLAQPEAEERSREAIEEVFDKGISSTSEWEFVRRDGKTLYLSTTAFPIRDQSGKVVAGIGATIDLTKRKQYERELEAQKSALIEMNERLSALALTDGLTQLYNHRSFQDTLEARYQEVAEQGGDLSLVLLDVDHFKNLNDTYGHPVGDLVLKAVANLLKTELPEGPIPCRYGGEEFVVILPDCSPDSATLQAEVLRQKLQELKPEGIEVTASFGVSSWSPEIRSRAEMIAQADKALYLSKEAGRNRVTHSRAFTGDATIAEAA